MSRSVWKGPFVEESLIKKWKKKNNPQENQSKHGQKIYNTTRFVGISFLIYNGKNLYQLQYLRIW